MGVVNLSTHSQSLPFIHADLSLSLSNFVCHCFIYNLSFSLDLSFSFSTISFLKMPDFCLASTKTKDLSTLLLSDFMLLCSLILSHPLYSSYFIFFSPYLFKLFSFLSPLFLTITLLLLTSVNHGLGGFDHSILTFLLLQTDHYEETDAFGCLEMLEAIKIAFETSSIEVLSKGDCFQASIDNKDHSDTTLDKKPTEILPPGSKQVKAVVKIFEEFLQEKDGVENLSSKRRDKEVKSLSVKSNKGSAGEHKEDGFMRMGSKANKVSDPKVIRVGHAAKAMLNDWSTENGDKYNYDYQTTRKQKEWNRTLACKLLEERHSQSHNVVDGGGEGMDLLWETYETDSDNKQELETGSNKGRKGGIGYYYDNDDYNEDGDETNGQLCCLQALKFSAGKMNLGMGKPNLVKIKKVIKGFGWLHHVTSRHAKKGYY